MDNIKLCSVSTVGKVSIDELPIVIGNMFFHI